MKLTVGQMINLKLCPEESECECYSVGRVQSFTTKRPLVSGHFRSSLTMAESRCFNEHREHNIMNSLRLSDDGPIVTSTLNRSLFIADFSKHGVSIASRCMICGQWPLKGDHDDAYCAQALSSLIAKYDAPNRDEAINYLAGGLIEDCDREFMARAIAAGKFAVPEYYLIDWRKDEEEPDGQSNTECKENT